MNLEEEDYRSTLEDGQKSTTNTMKATFGADPTAKINSCTCEAYCGLDELQSESCSHGSSRGIYETKPTVRIHTKCDTCKDHKLATCGLVNRLLMKPNETEDKHTEGNRSGVSVPLETWLKEEKRPGLNFIFKQLEAAASETEIDIDSLSLSLGELEVALKTDGSLSPQDKTTASSPNLNSPLSTHIPVPLWRPAQLEFEDIYIDKEILTEEDAHGLPANLAFLENLSQRFACPFAKINAAAYRTCMAVNRGDVLGIRKHLEKRHDLKHLPSLDSEVDPSSYWRQLFASALSQSQEEYPEPQYPPPYFDFNTLLQDASDLRRIKKVDVEIHGKNSSPLPFNDYGSNLLWISADENVDIPGIDMLGKRPTDITDISEELSTLAVLDYLSAALISDDMARRWLLTENQYITSWTQLEINLGTCSGTKGHHNHKGSQTAQGSSRAGVPSKRSRQNRSDRKKEFRRNRGDEDYKDEEDDEEEPEKPKPQGGTHRYLKKSWRCPYSIIKCGNHKKCWLPREIMRQAVTGIREHLRRAHFNYKLPIHLTAEVAPSWKDLFEGCLKQSCHRNWLGLGFNATWYRYIDECTSPSNSAKCYTPQQAKDLVAEGFTYIDEPEVFNCSNSGCIDAVENTALLSDGVIGPEIASTNTFDEGVEIQSTFSEVQAPSSFGGLEVAPNTQNHPDSQTSMSTYGIEEQSEYGYSILARYWDIPLGTRLSESSMAPTQATSPIKFETIANDLISQSMGISTVLGEAVEQLQTAQLQNPAISTPLMFESGLTSSSHNADDDSIHNTISAPQVSGTEIIIKVWRQLDPITQSGSGARTLKFRGLEELQLEFIGQMRKNFYGSGFAWGHPRWLLQSFNTGASITCIQDLEEELARGNDTYYLVDRYRTFANSELEPIPSGA
ncbi:hypothetical protein TWF506_003752 [Arthrobotrys conoides]|uniref:Uncharacterized protein n=1 Tax=Arthrobotrys conoides TaxID=74498 RepID=A0AAN8N3Y6_9PEZI